MTPRRHFFTTAGPGLLLLAVFCPTAEGAKLRRVSVLAPSTAAREAVTLKPFFDEMARLGWIEGQNIAYERSFANDQEAELARLAVELVARQPELIFAPPQVAAVAARRATATIPIVFATGTDPVGAGLVASLAHPGGNASGMVSVIETLAPKQLQLARELLPTATRFGFVGSQMDPRFAIDSDALTRHLPRGAARRCGRVRPTIWPGSTWPSANWSTSVSKPCSRRPRSPSTASTGLSNSRGRPTWPSLRTAVPWSTAVR